jgi:hypothetical protein
MEDRLSERYFVSCAFEGGQEEIIEYMTSRFPGNFIIDVETLSHVIQSESAHLFEEVLSRMSRITIRHVLQCIKHYREGYFQKITSMMNEPILESNRDKIIQAIFRYDMPQIISELPPKYFEGIDMPLLSARMTAPRILSFYLQRSRSINQQMVWNECIHLSCLVELVKEGWMFPPPPSLSRSSLSSCKEMCFLICKGKYGYRNSKETYWYLKHIHSLIHNCVKTDTLIRRILLEYDNVD